MLTGLLISSSRSCLPLAGVVFHCLVFLSVAGLQAADAPPRRVTAGLEVLYDFGSIDGQRIRDLSDHAQPLDLQIVDPKSVRLGSDGLEILGKTRLQTNGPPRRLMESIKRSGSLTIEAWVRPANVQQDGPARVVTLSRNTNERNFTLGQDGDRFDARLRTTKTSTNGMPSLASKSKSLSTDWTHVAYAWGPSGSARLYLDGKLQAEKSLAGAVSNWNDGFQLALANELSSERPWLGTYGLVAIYSHELSAAEIQQNHQAGRQITPPTAEELLALQSAANSKRFATQIAPLLSNHCLECHDTVTHRGKLDLSQRATALAGGEQGQAIVPGKSAESRIWQLVESDEMPHDRTPLSTAEKQLLKQWIDQGAHWSLDRIDPAVYAQGVGSQQLFVQRLTVPEYVETVRSTLGVEIEELARELLPRDVRADGFSNTAYNLNIDLAHIEAYARLAEMIVQRLDLPALVRRQTRSRELTDENVTKVITPVGKRLLRGPLSKDEIAMYCGISTKVAAAGGDFDEAIGYILRAMLQSPRFLYRIEHQRGDGSPQAVNQYELAARISYILWGGPPDDDLLTAADRGKLNGAELQRQAVRMLKDRRAVDHSLLFISQWLNLDHLENLRPSPKMFPNWDPRLADDMRRETLAYFEKVAWKQDRPLVDLLNAQVTFITPRLARHYGLPELKNPDADVLSEFDLKSVPAGGLLTHGSVLTLGGDDASMVARGLFVMNELLRGVVRDPPPCVDTTPVPSKPGLSQRAIAELRIANKSCTGCHSKFEPLSFGLERFDGLGTYHVKDEHGNRLRDDGNILFPGSDEPAPYQTSAELMDLLAASDRVRETFTWKVTQFALGRPLGARAAPLVAEIHRQAQQTGGTYASLMQAIVTR